jgi:hypothetical protein
MHNSFMFGHSVHPTEDKGPVGDSRLLPVLVPIFVSKYFRRYQINSKYFFEMNIDVA